MQTFTLNVARSGKWFTGTCTEVPGANGQGRTLMACTRSLVQAVALLTEQEVVPIPMKVEVEVAGVTTCHAVNLIESFEGYAALCPDLPGCCSQGDDEEEAIENIQFAIKDYLEVAEDIKLGHKMRLVKVA